MEDRLTYFRAKIITFDPATYVYWADRWDGESFDIHSDDIPNNAQVIDVTDSKKEKIYQKQGDKYNYIGRDRA